MKNFILQLRKVLLGRYGGNLSDGQLLESFIAKRDEAAFEELVRRHGPMVLRICRHVVGDEHDAEDAFQATFLVLVRKPESIVPRDHVSNWLCGVAFRTGQAARTARLRRRARERQLGDVPHLAAVPAAEPDLLPLIDRELNRLPEKFRLPIILCGMEGRGRKEVAAALSVPEGTLASRLDTARRRLAKRLARYGVAISAAATFLAPSKDGLAQAPPALVAATVRAGMATPSPAVLALANGVLQAALWLRAKTAAAVVLLVLFGVGSGVAAWQMNRADVGQTFALAHNAAPAPNTADPAPSARPELTDEERLQGVWNVLWLEQDGAAVPVTEKTGKHLVFVKDDQVMTHFLRVQEGHGYVTVTVRLNTTTTPKTIEVLHGGGRLWEGIYVLEEDTMKVCVVPFGYKRPTTFVTAANEAPVLVILKRDNSIVWDKAKWQKAVEEQS